MSLNKRPLCNSEFWSTELFWWGKSPTLTTCFQQTVLVGIPCGFLWITATACLIWERRHTKVPATCPYPWTLLSILKLALSFTLILLSCLELGLLFQVDSVPSEVTLPLMAFISVGIKIVTYVLALVLQVRQRLRRKLSSSTLFLFWFLHAVCEVWTTPIFQISEAKGDAVEIDQIQYILGSLSLPLILCQLVLSAFTDPSYNYLWKGKKDADSAPNQTLLCQLTFSFMSRLIWFGYRNTISVDDLEGFGSDKTAHSIAGRLLKYWKKEENKVKHRISGQHSSEEETQISKNSGKPSLAVALVKTSLPILLYSIVCEVLISFIVLVPPLILDMVISFTDNTEDQWHGYVYALALFLISAATTFLTVNALHIIVLTSLVPRLGLPAVVYGKCLRLSSAARREYTVGEMVNLLSVDTQKVFETVWFINITWACPLRIAITIALLWQYLGASCLAGFAMMILLMPITTYLARQNQIIQGKHMKLKDSRLRQLNEMFNGIKILKLFAWEMPFMEQIKGIRHSEVTLLKKFAIYKAFITSLWIFGPFLIAIFSFVSFVLMSEDNVLTPSIAFVSLTLFNSLRNTLNLIPEVASRLVQCHISLIRLQKFLLSEELDSESVGNNPSEGNCVVINNGMFSWSSEEPPFLKDIQLTIAEGSLVAIVGRVGSGKSALLSAILGEMHASQGTVDVKGSIGYVAQQAWIQNATLRNNILFLKDMDSLKYEKVLEMCCLKPDLKVLPAGDSTEIGEKGVNLSGGQKQRVSLARAVYQNCDVYILDDPLSAVDSHVGAHIFNHVIGPNGKLRRKTRILVTHDLSILPEVDQILVMADGRIVESGKYDDLMENKGDFSVFVKEHLKSAEENEDDLSYEEESEKKDGELLKSGQLSTEDLKKQMIRVGSILSRSHSTKEAMPSMQKIKRDQYIADEAMQTGRVKGEVFLSYFKNASCRFTIVIMMSYLAYQVFEIGSSFWLSAWSTDPPLPDGTQDIVLRNIRIGIYGVLGLGQGLCVLFATLVLAIASMRASVRFHSGMLMSVLRAPMFFFDTTPIGRILNRFGKDIDTVDADIPDLLDDCVTALITVLGTLVVISITNPLFVAIVLPLCILYITLQNVYMRTSRQLRRLLSVTLSPVLSCFTEAVQGTSTIRAFKAQEHFINREYCFLDNHVSCFINSAATNRWLGIRLELIGSVVVLIAALLAVAGRNDLNSGTVGLTLSYALNVSLALNTLVKHFTNLENRMVSVERINEYSDITSEDSWKKDTDEQVPKDWPSQGEVTFRNYSMSYRKNTDLVLRGVNLDIKPREKVGLVGRTGAGKSSFALALFRTAETVDGCINIDKLDIAALGLHTLRSQLTIIPQDPVLFSGTLRINLDPLLQHSDADLWNAIDHSRLKEFVSSLESGLDYHVTEGGDNLSVGQRQQLCLARALLKKTKVLILDEATAAMDMETDKLIQSSIRSEFQDSTVITIAHRLHTILDYDRIVVMDNGEVIEQGRPDFLLQDENTHFYRLGKDAGLL